MPPDLCSKKVVESAFIAAMKFSRTRYCIPNLLKPHFKNSNGSCSIVFYARQLLFRRRRSARSVFQCRNGIEAARASKAFAIAEDLSAESICRIGIREREKTSCCQASEDVSIFVANLIHSAAVKNCRALTKAFVFKQNCPNDAGTAFVIISVV